MKTIFNISVVTFVLVAASSPCFALWSVGQISKEQAKELGMEIRSKVNGTNAVWVELDFKTEGKLKSFNRVDLRISEGEKDLVTATLREDRSRTGRVVVSFSADRAHLGKITLWVYVANTMPGGTIYQLRVKDLVDSPIVETVRQESPNSVLEVRNGGPKTVIRADLDNAHELRLVVGRGPIGWSVQRAGPTPVTATVEASRQIKRANGSLVSGMIVEAWGNRRDIALSPGGFAHGEVVLRPNSMIVQDYGAFTFADIRETNGHMVPVSVCVRPVPAKSPAKIKSGNARMKPVIDTEAARIQLQQAQADLARIQNLYENRLVSQSEYESARLVRDRAAAEFNGDTAGILLTKLRQTEGQLQEVESKFKLGLASQAEVEKAKLVKNLAEAQLTGDLKAIVQAELENAQQGFLEVEAKFKAGVATQSELEKVKAVRDALAREHFQLFHAEGKVGSKISGEETTGIGTGAGVFGPVIERVIVTPDADDQGLVFFDMETGKSFKPPFPLTFRPNQGPAFVELTPALKQWIKARDVDVLLRLGEKTWNLMTLEMQENFVGQLNEWETISPEKVIGIFAAKDAEHLVRDEMPASSSGQSYRDGFGSFNAFRTRSNTIGVYQFQGVDNSTRRGVGVRYKLVQTASGPSTPALKSAPEYRTALVAKGALTQHVTATGTLNPTPDNTANWRINAPVAEADIVLVERGQNVDFTFDAFPYRKFQGKIVQVANTPVRMENVVCYNTVINVIDAEPKFRPGMTASINIIVEHRNEALKIPNAALRFRLPGSTANASMDRPQSERIVFILRSGESRQAEPVRIKIGISDGIFTEVTEGLKEGDRVVTGWISSPTAS